MTSIIYAEQLEPKTMYHVRYHPDPLSGLEATEITHGKKQTKTSTIGFLRKTGAHLAGEGANTFQEVKVPVQIMKHIIF